MMALKASGGGQLIPRAVLNVDDVIEHLSSKSGVPSQLGRQLDEQQRLSPIPPPKPVLAKLAGKEEAERAARAREDRIWRTMRIKPDSGAAASGESARVELAMLRGAQIMECIRVLSGYTQVQFTSCDEVRKFAKRSGVGEGAIAIEVVREWAAWRTESKERGLVAIYDWMRRHDPGLRPVEHDEDSVAQAFRVNKKHPARLRAAGVLLDAEAIMGSWVTLWNRRVKSDA